MDSFTCGTCKLMFHELDIFLEHKQKHDLRKHTCSRTDNSGSKIETVEGHASPHSKTPPVASSACDSSISFLNSVSRMECPSVFKESAVSPSQIPECPVTTRGLVSSAVGSPHINSFTSSKLLDENTCRFLEKFLQRYQESTKSSFSSTYIETGSSEGEDGDLILIEISESKREDGELRARVCRPSIEGLQASLSSSFTGTEEVLANGNDEEKSASRRDMSTLNEEEVTSNCCCNGHINSTVGFVCGNNERKSKHIQTHISSSKDIWKDPADGKKESMKSYSLCASSVLPCSTTSSEDTNPVASSFSTVAHSSELCINQSSSVFPTVYADDKLIESNTETERRLMHTSPQSKTWTSDSIMYTTPPKVTYITPVEPQNTNYCQEKVSVSRCDMTYEYAYRDKPKIDLGVGEVPCENILHGSGISSMGSLKGVVQERMENSSCKVSRKVVPDGDNTEEERLLPCVRNEAAATTENSSTEVIFAEHRDGSIPDSSMTQGLGEGALLNSESMNLVPGDCSELEYTPSPGIYTLILNADNTFSLVSEGCQSSATQACNHVFVCWPCQKFAPSQAEILSHISASHPQDLANINQCMLELSALSPSYGNGTLESVQHPSGRKVKKKLGRPRKEETIGQKQPEPMKRKFKVEAEGTLCLDCDRLFPKQRQFDKHRCSVWQDSHLPDQVLSKHSASPLTTVGKEADDIPCHEALQKEEAEEEEWQGNANYKSRSRSRGAEKRKRGRPPKVDQLGGDTVDSEAFTTMHLPREETKEELLRGRGGKQQPLGSSQSALNAISDPPQSLGPSQLQHIPTLPLFSNPHQQERLHKWIAQTDLSFVDDIIDKVYPERKVSEKRDVTAMFTCRECKLLFRTLTSCRRHCAKHMTKKAFTCPDCDFATANVGGLYSHYRNHTQNLYSCDKCDFRARIKAHYRDHLETHNPCRHICRICQKPYSTSSSLRSHIYLNHRNEEGMKYLWWLRRKNQEQDKQNVVFQCPVCHQLFSEVSLANQHFAAHGHSAPEEVLKCEVCGLEPLLQRTLKKHLLKHKVIYICCICYKPQVTASCLRSHLKEGDCSSSSREDSLMLSLLYSYTSSGTLPSLISSKILGIGPLLQDMQKYLSQHELPSTRAYSNLRHQMQSAGYRQISELLQDKLADVVDSSCKTESEVMKIVISTRCVPESSKSDHPQAKQTCTKNETLSEDPQACKLEEEELHGP